MAKDLSYTAKYWYIKRVNLFAGLSHQELEQIAAMSRMVNKPKGEFIYLPGDPATSVYVLKEGRVKISLLSESGKEIGIDIIEPGEVFGELALVDDSPRKSLAQALEDVLLCIFDKRDFEMMLQSRPQLAVRVAKFIGWRRRRLEKKLVDLLYKDVTTRIAELLLEFAREQGRADRSEVLIPLTHQDIADLVGASRQTTTSVLNDLERLGVIELGRRSVRVR